MSNRAEVTISIPNDLLAGIEASVAAGEHASVAAAIEAALEERAAELLLRQADPEKLAAFIRIGVDSGPDLDGEAVFAELIAECEADSVPQGA